MSEKGTKYRKIRFLLQSILMGVIFFVLARILYRNWALVQGRIRELDLFLVGLSLLLMIICGLLIALGWNLILRALGQPLSVSRSLRIFFLSELGKYLPGRVWGVMGRIFLARKEGVPKVLTAVSIGTLVILTLISGVLVSLLILPFLPNLSRFSGWYYIIFILPVGLIALHPRIFNPVLNWALRKFEKVQLETNLNYRDILLLVLYWVGLWFLKGVGTYLLLGAVSPEPLPGNDLIATVGIVSFAWTIGLLAIFVPSGLGVTEGLIVVLFTSILGVDAGIAAAVAIFSRLLSVISELFCVALTFRLK